MPCQQLNAAPAPRARCHRPGVAHQLHARDGVQGSGAVTAISARDAAFQPLAALSRAHRGGLATGGHAYRMFARGVRGIVAA